MAPTPFHFALSYEFFISPAKVAGVEGTKAVW
jgi:hypothetical protein